MKKFEFRVCFEKDSLSKEEIISNLELLLDFTPEWIISSTVFEDGDFFDIKKLNAVIDSKDSMFELSDKELYTKAFQFTTLSIQKIITLTWTYEDEMDNIPNNDIVKFLTNNEGFICAQKFEYYDAYWQSEIFELNYIAQNKSTKGLKYLEHEHLGKIIDISKNYGRDSLVNGLWLIASPEMWFGKGFFKYIEKNMIEKFQYAQEIKSLENECVFVKLFDYKENPENPVNRDKQKKFREWISMDELEMKLK